MSDLTVTVRYKGLSGLAAYSLCALWGLAVAAALFLALSSVHHLAFYLTLPLWVVLGVVFVYVPFNIVSFHREGGVLSVNSDGIALPPSFLGFGPRPNMHWCDLKRIDCSPGETTKLLLTTDKGAQLNIDTAKIPTPQVEQLMLAMDVWGHSASWSAPASNFRDELQNSRLNADSSFTSMWEDELKRRYTVTTFAPHSPGTTLSSKRYTILKQLAFGGFSAVYLCETENRERVVLKELVIKSENAEAQAKALVMFERESVLMAKLSHPNIARVLDHFVEDGRNYLVLEYVEGENLRELVFRKGPLSEKKVTDLARQMANILEYLHGLTPPMVHRDFTPDNLITSGRRELTLVDFGAANEYASSATGTLVGKQSYMPIEQIRGKAEPCSDLYAMGGVLQFLVTGKDPEPISVCLGSQSSIGLNSVIQRLTQIEPHDRLQSAAEVSRLLASL